MRTREYVGYENSSRATALCRALTCLLAPSLGSPQQVGMPPGLASLGFGGGLGKQIDIHALLPNKRLLVAGMVAEHRGRSQAWGKVAGGPEQEEWGPTGHSCTHPILVPGGGFSHTHFLTLRGRAAGGARELLLV